MTGSKVHTAASLLPPEILLSALALTHPSRRLPATCRLIATAFRSADPTLKRSWHHHIIFYQAPRHGLASKYETSFNATSHGGGQQIPSRFALFLKFRLPGMALTICSCPDDGDGEEHDCPYGRLDRVCYATFGAPDVPLKDPYINESLVAYLFAPKSGLFARHPVLTSAQIQHQLASFWTKAVMNHPDEESQVTFQYTIKDLPHLHWQLLPDAILLLVFFLRAGEAKLFRRTLSLLHQHQPSLATTSAPLFHWSALALDNRYEIRQAFEDMTLDDPTISISFPIFLATLCAFNWSVPCLEAVTQILHLDPFEFTLGWIDIHPEIMDSFLTMCCDVSGVTRVSQVLDWFEEYGVDFDFEFPMSVRAGTQWPVFIDMFNKYDRPLVDAGGQHQEARHALGDWIVRLAFLFCEPQYNGDKHAPQEWDGLCEVIRLGFKKQLMSAESKGSLYSLGLAAQDAGEGRVSEWAELVEEMTDEDEWLHMLRHAINASLPPAIDSSDFSSYRSKDYIPDMSVVARLLDQLYTHHNKTPTEHFAQDGRSWDWHRARPFFECHPLPVAFDFMADARQVVDWLLCPPRAAEWLETTRNQMEVVSHLLDKAMGQDAAAAKAQLLQMTRSQVATMIAAGAWYLGMRSVWFETGGDVPCVPSVATRAVLVDVWAALLAAGEDKDEDNGGESSGPCAASHLADQVLGELRALVQSAASEAGVAQGGSLALSPMVAQGESELGQALALLVELDSEFVTHTVHQSEL